MLRHLHFLFVSIVAIEFIFAQNSDLNLQNIYHVVETKLEDGLRQEMGYGSTSCHHSRRRSLNG